MNFCPLRLEFFPSHSLSCHVFFVLKYSFLIQFLFRIFVKSIRVIRTHVECNISLFFILPLKSTQHIFAQIKGNVMNPELPWLMSICLVCRFSCSFLPSIFLIRRSAKLVFSNLRQKLIFNKKEGKERRTRTRTTSLSHNSQNHATHSHKNIPFSSFYVISVEITTRITERDEERISHLSSRVTRSYTIISAHILHMKGE